MSKKNRAAERKRRRLERRAVRQAENAMPSSGPAPGDLPEIAAEIAAGKPPEQLADLPAGDCAKLRGFLLDLRKEEAAQLLAEGDVSATEIARQIGVCVRTVFLWKEEPEFAARVEHLTAHAAALRQRRLLARKSVRLGRLCERHARIERMLDARSMDPDVQKAPGGDTGLVVRRERAIGSGPAMRFVEEFEYDAAPCKELREIEKQIAAEVGDLVTKIAPTTPDGNAEFTGIPAPSLEEFEKLPVEERIRILRQPVLLPPGRQQGAR